MLTKESILATQNEYRQLDGKRQRLIQSYDAKKAQLDNELAYLKTTKEETPERSFSQFIIDDLEKQLEELASDAKTLKEKLSELKTGRCESKDLLNLGAARCPRCSHVFLVSQLKGYFLNRICPVCEERIDEDLYKSQAKVLKDRRKTATTALGCLRTLDMGKDVQNKIDELIDDIDQQIAGCAISHYHMSEFYLLTGTPLSDKMFCDYEHAYEFTLSYDEHGELALVPVENAPFVAGIEGEMIVLRTLRRAIIQKDSPLNGAKLVPNISLASAEDKKGRLTIKRSQLDCAVLMSNSAFVVETKRWAANITVKRNPIQLTVKRKGEPVEIYEATEGPVGQNELHSKALVNECEYLTRGHVGKVTVFVNPVKFSSSQTFYMGSSNTFVGTYRNHANTFIKAMEDMASRTEFSKQKLSDAELCREAQQLLQYNSCRPLPVEAKYA